MMKLIVEDQVFPDYQSVMNHMQQIASCGGTRTGKQLRRDPHVTQGSTRLTMICMNPACALRLCARRKRDKTYYMDSAVSIKEHYVLNEDGVRGPCVVFGKASQVYIYDMYKLSII